jgi:Tol biopolymer transport system component
MSPNGKEIVIVQTSNLWLYELASGTGHPLTSSIDAHTPEWTPDGHRVLFIVRPDSGGPWEAWWTAVDRSSPPERLVAMPIPIRKIVLSPDSRFAVMEVRDSPNIHALYVVDLKGDRKPVPLEHSSFDSEDPRISPDGHWLTYVFDESGHREVYLRPFPGGGAHVQVSTDGGDDPRWEKDSCSIVYRNADQFIKARLAVGPGIAVVQRDLLSSGPYDGYDVGPNGSIVALRPDSADAEIIVVTNWIAELKAKLGKK